MQLTMHGRHIAPKEMTMLWIADSNVDDGLDRADFAVTLNPNATAPAGLAQPERNLLLAVLIDAIEQYRRLATIHDAGRRRHLLEAARWIMSDDREWPYSFINVCEALGLEPRAFRRALIEGRFAATAVEGESPVRIQLRRRVTERPTRAHLKMAPARRRNTGGKAASIS